MPNSYMLGGWGTGWNNPGGDLAAKVKNWNDSRLFYTKCPHS